MIVLGSAMLVAVLGMAAVMSQRIQLRISEAQQNMAKARIYARSGIELAVGIWGGNADWRSELLSGNIVPCTAGGSSGTCSIGDGTYTVVASDPGDNDIGDSIFDTFEFKCTGVSGNARHILKVKLKPTYDPVCSLEVASQSGDNTRYYGAVVKTDQTIRSNNDVGAIQDGSWCFIYSDVEAADQVYGRNYYNDRTTGISSCSVPGSDVYDYYIANGTSINVYDLPTNNGRRLLSEIVLSPKNNPYGDTNEEGIYVIDCDNQAMWIHTCRIVGTLILLNQNGTWVSYSMNWEPAVTGYPAILAQRDIDFYMNSSDLSESSANVNFNPSGTPYEGDEDNDRADSYPTIIKGIVYVGDDISTHWNCNFKGTMIARDDISGYEDLNIEYDPEIPANPPPGFRVLTGTELVSGSWQQVVE